jgi:signal transduction histidine kinase
MNAELEQRVRERTAVAEDRAAQLRVLASRLATAENQERRRVAQILHEHFQQLLVSVNFHIGVLRRRVADKSLLGILDRMSETIGETVQVSRTLTVELCPPVLYDMGLAAGLEWLGRWMKDRYDLQVDVSADPKANPRAMDMSVLLFHSTREVLFNIVKHAGVKQASLHMARRDRDHAEILVADEGIGFDPSSRPTEGAGTTGFGLFNIRERIELAGGRMQIDSSPGGGTRITLLAPLQQAESQGENQTTIIASP